MESITVNIINTIFARYKHNPKHGEMNREDLTNKKVSIKSENPNTH